jgi:hypothetical protein
MRTQKGFATILLISILPLVLAGGLAFFSAFSFLKSDMSILNVCRAKQLQVQNKVGESLGKLLKLNPRALKLRLAQARAEKTLAVALESGFPPAIAAAETYLLKVRMQRQTLDFKQKTFIQTANAWLTFSGHSLQKELIREENLHTAPTKSWIQGTLQLMNAKVPKLAVQPDLPDVAPQYNPVPDFEEAQAWNQTWRLEIKTVSWAQKFLNFNGRFNRSCMTSLYPTTNQNAGPWIAKLKKDKSSLKAFF